MLIGDATSLMKESLVKESCGVAVPPLVGLPAHVVAGGAELQI